jgi:hypothetical protein
MSTPAARLTIVPCTLEEANAYVRAWHRHHRAVRGHRFSLAVATQDAEGEPDLTRDVSGDTLVIVGVAIVGRPVARQLDDGWTLEVTRVATDGTKNAASALYGAARRATFALGYKRLVTYTLPSESGASLRAAGYRCLGEAGGGSWSRESRPRVDTHPTQRKLRWEAA